MNSLRHVFWRGAMALSLMALGIGSGFGFREAPLQAGATTEGDCTGPDLRVARPRVDAAVLAARLDRARDVAQRVRAQAARRG